jgi:luciferase family oxidoreductase group 1
VLLAHAAGVTSTIRLGSGGVMLPNHAPLVVAEQFGMLEALHPGRIDLGLGRAPGTDQLTALALRRSRRRLEVDEFPEQLVELVGYFTGAFPRVTRSAPSPPSPASATGPLCGCWDRATSALRLAGVLGLPFSFAHHFAAANTLPALAAYRQAFRPSDDLAAPYVMLGVSVVAAEDDERARWLAGSGALAFVRLRTGRPGRYPRPKRRPGTPSRHTSARSSRAGRPRTSWADRTPCGEGWPSWWSGRVPTSSWSPRSPTTQGRGWTPYRLVAKAAGLAPVPRGDPCLIRSRRVSV